MDEETGIHQFFAENLQEMMGGAAGADASLKGLPNPRRSTGFNEVIEDADADGGAKAK